MNCDKQKIAMLFYDQKVAEQKKISSLDGEFEAIERMLAEIRMLGYDYHYLADIEMRTVKDKRIMEILYRYYPEMEFISTREILALAIKPNMFPGIVDYAVEGFLSLPVSDKIARKSFDICISRHKYTDAHIERVYELLKTPENYAALDYTGKKFCKYAPEKAKSLADQFKEGPLLLAAVRNLSYISDNESISSLERYKDITDNEIKCVISQSSYPVNVTVSEYFRRITTADEVRKIVRTALAKYYG